MELTALLGSQLSQYSNFGVSLAIDVMAILVMAYSLYFRRHWRSDLLLSYVALNIGIFSVMSLLGMVQVNIAVGFGLFAILSIIRLRSSAVTQQEVAYYFISLVLGLINGMNLPDHWFTVLMNALLLVTMLIMDNRRIGERTRRLDVHLDKAYPNETQLVEELERKLGGRVLYHEVSDLDFVHDHMTVDVRYRPGPNAPLRSDDDRPRSSKKHPVEAAEPAPAAPVALAPWAAPTMPVGLAPVPAANVNGNGYARHDGHPG